MQISLLQQTLPKISPPKKDYEFGKLCLELRRMLDYTQDEMARFLGVALRTYKYWEAGEREPSARIAFWLAEMHKELKEKEQ